MNAIELLRSDHQLVNGMFEEALTANDSQRRAIADKIRSELEAHAHIEETIFYPRLKAEGNEELFKIVSEGIEEHQQVKDLLKAMGSGSDAKRLGTQITHLMNIVNHHVQEEEGEMFPLVEDQFKRKVLDEWGVELQREKIAFQTRAGIKVNAAAAGAGRLTIGGIIDRAIGVVSGAMAAKRPPAASETKPAGSRTQTKGTATKAKKNSTSSKASSASGSSAKSTTAKQAKSKPKAASNPKTTKKKTTKGSSPPEASK